MSMKVLIKIEMRELRVLKWNVSLVFIKYLFKEETGIQLKSWFQPPIILISWIEWENQFQLIFFFVSVPATEDRQRVLQASGALRNAEHFNWSRPGNDGVKPFKTCALFTGCVCVRECSCEDPHVPVWDAETPSCLLWRGLRFCYRLGEKERLGWKLDH